MDDRSQVDLLGGDERETLRKIESELMAKTAEGAGASPVRPGGAIFKDVSHQVEIRLHGERLYHRPSGLARLDGSVTALEKVRDHFNATYPGTNDASGGGEYEDEEDP